MSASGRGIPTAVNPVSGESNSRRQRSEPRVEHHLGAAVAGRCVRARSRSFSARRPKVRFGGHRVEARDPGEERCATVPVMFWQNGLTMRSVPRDSTNSSATSPPATPTKCSRGSSVRSGRRSSSRRRHRCRTTRRARTPSRCSPRSRHTRRRSSSARSWTAIAAVRRSSPRSC